MNAINEIATRSPVNRQAARVMQKAPWWAHYSEIPKQAEKLMPVHEWRLCADLFLPPPRQVGQKPPTDRRGTRVKFHLEKLEAVITGHHRIKRIGGNNIHVWWAICEDGSVTTLTWGGQSKKSKRWELI